MLPFLQFPSVAVLFLWMIVPLGMTIYFSFIRKNLPRSWSSEPTGSIESDPEKDDPMAIF